MSAIVSIPSGAQLFSPLARALLDGFAEAVVLFDPDGHITFANAAGRTVLESLAEGGVLETKSLLQRLGRLGGRVERVTTGTMALGSAVFLPVRGPHVTLAERERRAIIETLEATGWRLTETARRLGISRTTLWRRLREWGIDAPPGVLDGERTGPQETPA